MKAAEYEVTTYNRLGEYAGTKTVYVEQGAQPRVSEANGARRISRGVDLIYLLADGRMVEFKKVQGN